MYRQSDDRSESSGDGWATDRVIRQATGVLTVLRGTSIPDAAAFLSASAESMGVGCGALSRLIIDALNARGTGHY